ncbi:MAG: short-chain dehydrogenase [Robiginitomaculum sp.]|nr:MAG: short-chain dehydrogenase [Robiginitomaculum sp.]
MAGLLKDKVALITGAGAGIGRGVARKFIQEGAKVVVAEINEENGRHVVKELIDELGGEACFIKTNVCIKEDVEAAVTHCIETYGGIDILVNNAFALSPHVVLEKKTDEMLANTLNSGLWASWWAMRAALPSMKKRGGGKIVNFYSIDADVAAWCHADYNMTKSAVLGLTRSAAAEWGRFNINVNAIAPAARGTVFYQLAEQIPNFEEKAAARKPLCRNGDPEDDIGPVVVFLCSAMSSYITGEMINVDGGLHLPGYDSKPPELSVM